MLLRWLVYQERKDFPQDLAQQSSLLHEDIYQLDPVFFKRYQ